jgi:hypothetical protein
VPEGEAVGVAVREPVAVALADARSVSVPVGVPELGGDTERDGDAGGLTDGEGVGGADAITVAVADADAPGESVAVTDGVGVGDAADGRAPRT